MNRISFSAAGNRGQHIITPRYAFLTQNALYGLVENLRHA